MTSEVRGDVAVEFIADTADLEKAFAHELLNRARKGKSEQQAAQSRRTHLLVMIVSCAIAMGIFAAIIADWMEPNRLWVIVAIVLPAISIAAWANLNPKKMIDSAKRQAAASARSPEARVVLGRYVVQIQSEGVRVSGEQYELLYRWPIMLRIDEDVDAIHLQAVTFSACRIPKRAFNDVVTQQQFVEAFDQRIVKFGFDVSTRILAYVNSKGGKCPGCGYSLANLTANRCPECGRVPTLADFPSAIHALGHTAP